MMYLSKSKYCELWQCPKKAWLKKYKPDALELTDDVLSRMEAGNEVGDLAMGLFGNYTEVTAYQNGKLDLPNMISATKREMEKGTNVICEASFDYKGLYCAVDILRKTDNGWAIYEVKSSTHDKKDIYIADIAYQKYVLTHCGVKLDGIFLICLDNHYIFDGQLDIHKLFKITDVTSAVDEEEKNITANLSLAQQLLSCSDEPDIDLSAHCHNPYPCGFWKYCTKHIPTPSVFDLYKMYFSEKIDLYKEGYIAYSDLLSCPEITNKKQLRQIEYALSDKGTYIEKDHIKSFLDTLSFPLYFLDFETMQPVIPIFIGTKPYTQIPFQYSLHYIETDNGILKHKEFLAQSGTDPRRALAEQLCLDIPENACVLAYNQSFECTQIKNLAHEFSDLSDHLLHISSNIRDLLVPFQSGYYYNRAMGSSFSIKSVLPAIFPNDPTLDYHNLEGVHNGGEAMSIFPKIQYMEEHDQEVARRNLLKYCELDTYAMVKVWQALVDAVKE